MEQPLADDTFMIHSLLDSPTFSTEETSEALQISNETSEEMQSSPPNTPSEGQRFNVDNLGERTILQPQQPQNGSTATVSDLNTKLQDLTRQLEAAGNKLDQSEKEHKLTEEKLAITSSERDQLRARLMTCDQVTDMFKTITGFVSTKKCEIADLKLELGGRHSPGLRLLEEAKVVSNRSETLTTSGSAKEKVLQDLEPDADEASKSEEALVFQKARNKDLIRKLEAEALSVSHLTEKNAQIPEKIESLRTDAQSAQQALLDRLDTVLQERLEPIALDNMLQTLVDKQNTALTNVQNELAMAKSDHLLDQKELEQVKKNLNDTRREHRAFRDGIEAAVGLWYYGTETLVQRIARFRTELDDVASSLVGIYGDDKVAKIQTLKIGCKDLNSVSMELENTRKDRDGIYKTLNVSNCLQAHLTIGDLKLSQLECEILRKAIGEFEDEEAVCEIKRLKKADLELVKVVSALDGCVGDSNVAKIDTLKAACKME